MPSGMGLGAVTSLRGTHKEDPKRPTPREIGTHSAELSQSYLITFRPLYDYLFAIIYLRLFFSLQGSKLGSLEGRSIPAGNAVSPGASAPFSRSCTHSPFSVVSCSLC